MAKKKIGKKKLGIILTTVGCVLLGSLCISLAVKLDRTDGNVKFGSEHFVTATISVDGKLDKADNSAICLSSNKSVDGLKIDIKEDSDLDYTLFFFNEDGEFISSATRTETEAEGFAIPEEAKTFNIMISIAEDDDISMLEKIEYLKGIEVSIAK